MKSLLTLLLVVALPACAQQGAKRYIVGFAPHASQAQKSSAVARLGGHEVDELEELGLIVAEVPDSARLEALSPSELQSLAISSIEEDVYYPDWLVDAQPPFQAWPSWAEVRAVVPRFARATSAQNPLPAGVDEAEVPWGIRRVNAPNAWAVTEGEGVRVAVVDTGIDANHPDLAGQVAGGYNAIDKKAPYFDDNSHGTHVSGTIAARRDGRGVVGVAPKARLFAVKVLDKDGGGSLFSIIRGLVWCGKNNIQVANMSLGSPIPSLFMHLAVNYAASHGVALAAAAGNSGRWVGYPASYAAAIAVAASDSGDHIAKFSSRGRKVEFIAPGVNVNSTLPHASYGAYSGTSMATPHVAGLAALAVARGAKGPEAVRSALRRSARSIGLPPTEQGYGMIDAARLVQ